MRAVRIADARAFAAAAGPFLEAHEAEHNLALGLLGRLHDEPRLYGFDPTFVVAEDEGRIVGCLLRTPPHNVILSRFDSLDVIDAVAGALHEAHEELPGAVGPSEVVARFAGTWAKLAGTPARLGIRQRVHAARAVRPLERARGRMREAGPDDLPIVLRWLQAFVEEALGEASPIEEVEASYRRREADPDGTWLIWDDGVPTSLAAYGNPTPHGTRIGPVYTPPEHRGRGYATSLVADVTAERLGAGHSFCFLFTDLANPTSNAIYARIGYEPVADWDLWTFAPLQG